MTTPASDLPRLALIDLSAIFRRNYHATEHEPVGKAYSLTVRDCHRYASAADHAAVCIDMPPYERKKLSAEYKANRDKEPQQMYGQLEAVLEQLRKDGLFIIGHQGAEADDVIATICHAVAPRFEVFIISADKDLLQLVDTRTKCVSNATGEIRGVDEVKKKYEVRPHKMHELLALWGDKSDNVPGVRGIGQKKAAKLLNEYGSIAGIYKNISKLSEGLGVALAENEKDVRLSLDLVRLDHELPIDVQAIFEKREAQAKAAPAAPPPPSDDEVEFTDDPSLRVKAGVQRTIDAAQEGLDKLVEQPAAGDIAAELEPQRTQPRAELDASKQPELAQRILEGNAKGAAQDVAVTEPSVSPNAATGDVPGNSVELVADKAVDAAPASTALTTTKQDAGPPPARPAPSTSWELALEPKHQAQAWDLAVRLYESMVFDNFPTPNAIYAAILTGRNMRIPAMAAARGFHVIEGKLALQAWTLVGLIVSRDDVCSYLRCVETTKDQSTWEALRVGSDKPVTYTFDMAEAEQAGLATRKIWIKRQREMLNKTAATRLARIVFPDLLLGLYTAEELEAV